MLDAADSHCPTCSHPSPPGRRFCTACGGPLYAICPSCGAHAAVDDRFCGCCGAPLGDAGASKRPARAPSHLAERILHARSALEGERKQATALVVDLVDSMELAQRFDAEEWRRILDRYFQLLVESVHAWEGFVDQFTGDGILALFGVPIAHEDHAARACLAACRVRDHVRRYGEELARRHGIDFAVRMGLHSGELIVGRIGDDLHTEYTAPGYTVGLAARMEKLAGSGRICATRDTAALAAGYVSLRPLGRFAVRGSREPLEVFEVEGPSPVRTRLDVSLERGLSRFVGRDEELAILEGALAAVSAGDARTVEVVGDPGVGKSRLCREFVDRCRSDGLRVHTASCPSHGRGIAFLPIRELLRACFAIADGTPDDAVRAAVRAALAGLDEKQRERVPLLFELLGVADPELALAPMDPEARQRHHAALVISVLRLLGAREPVVLLVDDLQWIDAASHALLAEIVPALAGTRTLLVVNYRPEYRPPWLEARRAPPLCVAPLDSHATDELLRHLLGSDPAVVALGARIRARTGGNPFFVEEVVRSLAEAGSLHGTPGDYRLARPVEQVTIPPSLHAVLAARIDRLEAGAKGLLQAAAVIGGSFSRSVLQAAVGAGDEAIDAGLRVLTAAGLVHHQGDSAESPYAFHHPLTREVAYGSQLRRQRAGLHAAVARAIHDQAPERAHENAALLAHHWEQAGDALQAARWHARAGEWRSVDQAPDAMRHWWKVLDGVGTLPASDETSALGLTACVRILNLGWRLGLTEREADDLYAQGRRFVEWNGDQRALAMLANLYVANVQAGLGRALGDFSPQTLARAREAARLAERSGDPGVRLAVRVNRLYALFLQGDLRAALSLLEDTLAQAPADRRRGSELFGFSPIVWIRGLQGQLLSCMGRPDEAAPALEEALRWAADHGEVENRGWLEGFSVTRAWAVGDRDAALAHGRRAVEIADTAGSAFSRILAHKSLGIAHLLGAEWKPAQEALAVALAVSEAQRANVFEEASVHALLAQAHLGAGDAGVAAAHAEQAVAVARQRQARLYECQAELARARVLLARDGARAREAVSAALYRAAALVEETGAASFAPHVSECRAALARAGGDPEGSRRDLTDARRRFAAMGAEGHVRRVDRLLGGEGARERPP